MLTSTATTVLRSGMARSAGPLQLMLFRAAICPYSTGSAVTPLAMAIKPTTQRPAATKPRAVTSPSPAARPLIIRFCGHMQSRSASSTTTSTPRSRSDSEADAAAAAAAAARQTAAHPEQESLDWNTFFQLRKTRRRLQQIFSVVGALGGGSGGALFLSTGAAESVVGKIPLDPFVTLGLMTFSFSALGWLIGPVLGTAVFNVFKRRFKAQMATKESQFFVRIKKHRVDPTSSSMNNPVPDFYGEKISSVAGYRQWLKDQRAYIKKRSTPFL